MTTATTATTGKVISSLVKEYQSIIAGNESAIRAFIVKAHKTPARDLEATLKEASKAGAISAIRPAYANYFGLANTALAIAGADKVAVADFMKTVAVAQRTLKKDGALALVAKVSSWSDFEAKTREAEAGKKAANPRKGEARKAGAVTVKGATADAVIAQALANLGELEDVTITDFDKAEYLIGALKSALASSKSMKAKHPTRKAVNA